MSSTKYRRDEVTYGSSYYPIWAVAGCGKLNGVCQKYLQKYNYIDNYVSVTTWNLKTEVDKYAEMSYVLDIIQVMETAKIIGLWETRTHVITDASKKKPKICIVKSLSVSCIPEWRPSYERAEETRVWPCISDFCLWQWTFRFHAVIKLTEAVILVAALRSLSELALIYHEPLLEQLTSCTTLRILRNVHFGFPSPDF